MKLTEICKMFEYQTFISPAEYEWGGRELHINVVPLNSPMPSFTLDVIKGEDSTILVNQMKVFLDFQSNIYGMKTEEFSKFEHNMFNGKVVMGLLSKINWKEDFEEVWNAETCEVTA